MKVVRKAPSLPRRPTPKSNRHHFEASPAINPRPSQNAMTERGPDNDGNGIFRMAEIEPSLEPPASQKGILGLTEPSSYTFEASAPRSLVHAYTALYETHRDDGKDHGDAHHRATREIQRRGWRKTKDGWKQVMPDLSDKINVAQGVEQPDGTYYIEGVPVFHPNAVKGIPFDADKIRTIIKNTNASIHAGGAKPGITEGHPSEMQSMIGKQLDTHGSAVNFRENPDKPGHTMCDLIDVEPDYFQRLKERKLPGLSAGFAKDCNDLNRRFGHVALLGGTSPALSHLPATEFFQSGNDLCFGADMEVFPKGKAMRSKKTKELFADVASAQDAYDAAEMAQESGDPTAEAKMGEAYAALCKKNEAYAASMASDAASAGGDMAGGDPMNGGGPVGNTVQDDSMPATVGNGAAAGQYGDVPPMDMPSGSTVSPQMPAQPMNFSATIEDIDFINHPEDAFAALIENGKQQEERSRWQERQLAEAHTALKAMALKNRMQDVREKWLGFSAKVETLRRDGRDIPDAKMIREEFTSFGDYKDPDKAIKLALKRYESLPKHRTPATVNRAEPVFAAGGADDGTGVLPNTRPANGQQRAAAKQVATRALGQSNADEVFAAAYEDIDWSEATK